MLIFRKNTNRTVPKHCDFNINNLNLMESITKREPYRDAFLYEKALKTDIYAVRFALTALFSFKK